jgi:hypothetical protein
MQTAPAIQRHFFQYTLETYRADRLGWKKYPLAAMAQAAYKNRSLTEVLEPAGINKSFIMSVSRHTHRNSLRPFRLKIHPVTISSRPILIGKSVWFPCRKVSAAGI